MGHGLLFPLALYIPSYSGGNPMRGKGKLNGLTFYCEQIEAVIVGEVSYLELYSLVESYLEVYSQKLSRTL